MSPSVKSRVPPSGYFTCSLGEVIEKLSLKSNLQTIDNLIDHQSKVRPEDIAVAFPVPRKDSRDWGSESFTFERLQNGSMSISAEMSSAIPSDTESLVSGCVALLCISSVDLLLSWLGLMRAGYSVLLLAPQLQPAAIAHLCHSCKTVALFYDKSLRELALEATSVGDHSLPTIELPWQTRGDPITSLIKPPGGFQPAVSQESGSTSKTAFIFHTSGTSTGLPKPILLSHHAAFRVLPSFAGQQHATFSTTPLYHGGIADCLRAWTSGAPIWLFPAAEVPITTQNIQLSLSAAATASVESLEARIRYFSSVPYVLEVLSKDSSGLDILQSMEIVGVGGAALSPAIGNYLVRHGVNLVSRFGSAECGFLLSSHRDYQLDKEWQYLRLPSDIEHLHFETQSDGSGLYELIVKKGWPHMAKTNREDGSFATSDLFEPHKSIKGAWKYHSRSDSQITLTTGKKFDPAPIEDLISTGSPFVREVLVFGSNRQNPGALVFPSIESLGLTVSGLADEIWKVVRAANSKGQNHSRIARNRLAIKSVDDPKLKRTSKGTLLRTIAEKRFCEDIENIYNNDDALTFDHVERVVLDEDVRGVVLKIITSVWVQDHSLREDDNFYAHGLDSTTSVRIRSLLQRNLVPTENQLPWNVVYDCGSIRRLIEFITRFRKGIPESQGQQWEEVKMLELVKSYTKFDSPPRTLKKEKSLGKGNHVVLLTGATGALGAHILDILRQKPSVSQVICLVRAVDHHTARSRVSASLVKRRKTSLDISDPKVWCSPCKLNDSNLGLSDMEMLHLRLNVTHIIHAAWAVNFSIPLMSFVDQHITGLRNLLNFALCCSYEVFFSFCSSTASVLGQNPPHITPELASRSPSEAGPTGYSQSKWVAEAMCAAASESLPGSVSILRIGQLTGDTENGIWNISEAWPLMLSTVEALDCLPRLEEFLSWLPLDIAARAVTDIAFQDFDQKKGARVYHLVNNSIESTWLDLLDWIGDTRTKPFEIVSPIVWMERLESYPRKQPAKNLLGLWRNTYVKDEKRSDSASAKKKVTFSVTEAQKSSKAMRDVTPINKELVRKIWHWLDDEMNAAKAQVFVSVDELETM